MKGLLLALLGLAVAIKLGFITVSIASDGTTTIEFSLFTNDDGTIQPLGNHGSVGA